MKTNLIGFTLNQLQIFIQDLGQKPFRAQQIMHWLYKKNVLSLDQMSNLPDAFRAQLAQITTIDLPKIIDIAHSERDKSYKFLLQAHDGKYIESILMFCNDRATLCVSCMIGCPLRCRFCATGSELGFIRKLTSAEIIGQVLAVKQYAQETSITDTISNIVFMGMGEPFLNKEAVGSSIDILLSDYGFGYSRTRITISTAGVDANIAQFINKYRVYLAVSLHFTNNELRSKYMPINDSFPIEKLVDELKKIKLTKRDYILIEYIMIDGVNDSLEHAKQLVRILSFVKTKVNLIPYNPTKSFEAKPSTEERLNAFAKYLQSKSIMATVRRSAGTDIDGGCGQFALRMGRD